MSLGVVYGWPSVIVLIKPSLFPFALFRARSRKWWLCLGVFILLSVPFGALWLDWVHSVLNSEGGGVTYSALGDSDARNSARCVARPDFASDHGAGWHRMHWGS